MYDWKLVMHMVLKFKYNAKDFLHFNHLNSYLMYWKINIYGIFPKMYISYMKIAWKIQFSWLCFTLLKLVPENFDYGKTTVFLSISKDTRAIVLAPASFLCHFNRRCPHLAATPPRSNMLRNIIKFNRSCPCFEDTLDLKPLTI